MMSRKWLGEVGRPCRCAGLEEYSSPEGHVVARLHKKLAEKPLKFALDTMKLGAV
jgi:hypothetical protein